MGVNYACSAFPSSPRMLDWGKLSYSCSPGLFSDQPEALLCSPMHGFDPRWLPMSTREQLGSQLFNVLHPCLHRLWVWPIWRLGKVLWDIYTCASTAGAAHLCSEMSTTMSGGLAGATEILRQLKSVWQPACDELESLTPRGRQRSLHND